MRTLFVLLGFLECLLLHSSTALLFNNGSVLLVDKRHLDSFAPSNLAYWDPNDVAPNEDFVKHQAKGNLLRCLLEMTDEQAGKAWPDPLGQTPKSASSQWKGTLEGTHINPTFDYITAH